MSDSSTTVEPGRIIGSYRVVRLIGAGGMAEVHEAEHVRLGRRVALKILKPHYAAKPEAVRSFFEEARLVSALDNEHIVQVTDLIVEPGLAVCVMELLQGRTLAEELESQGALDVPDALRIAHAVADALAAAHEAGVVHRDIKPDNIFLAKDRPGHRTVKLLDFGVAHLMDESQGIGGSSLSGQQAGTPAYMSPEQIQGQPVKPSSDIYSMGVVTYQMLTGKLPFVANSFAEYVYKHAHEQPVPPHKAVDPPRTISRHCSDFVMRCLSKDPGQRLQNGTQLRDAIERTARTTGMLLHTGAQPALVRTSPGFGHLSWLLFILVALAGVGLWAASCLFDLGTRNGIDSKSAGSEENAEKGAAPPAPKQPISKEDTPGGQREARPNDAALPGSRPGNDAKTTTQAKTLRIISEPPGAEVFLVSPQRRPLGITPLEITMPPDQEQWTIRVKASDRIPVTLTLNRKTASPVRVTLQAPAGSGTESASRQPRSKTRPRRRRRRPRRHHRPGRHRGGPDSIGTVNPFRSSH